MQSEEAKAIVLGMMEDETQQWHSMSPHYHATTVTHDFKWNPQDGEDTGSLIVDGEYIDDVEGMDHTLMDFTEACPTPSTRPEAGCTPFPRQ